MELQPDEYILTAYSDPTGDITAFGGYNVVVVVFNRVRGEYRLEFIEPPDQTEEMQALHAISTSTHRAMLAAIDRDLGERSKRKRRAT